MAIPTHLKIVLIHSISLVGFCSVGVAQATFVGLGDLDGGPFGSVASAISADGSAVVGFSVNEFGREAFRWSERASNKI